jgi:hypothetical protein
MSERSLGPLSAPGSSGKDGLAAAGQFWRAGPYLQVHVLNRMQLSIPCTIPRASNGPLAWAAPAPTAARSRRHVRRDPACPRSCSASLGYIYKGDSCAAPCLCPGAEAAPSGRGPGLGAGRAARAVHPAPSRHADLALAAQYSSSATQPCPRSCEFPSGNSYNSFTRDTPPATRPLRLVCGGTVNARAHPCPCPWGHRSL